MYYILRRVVEWTNVLPKFLRYSFLLFIAHILISCNKSPEDHIYTIGISQCVGSDLWRKTMLEEMRMELSLHPNLRIIYRDADGNSVKQIFQIKQLLAQKIDLLIVSPNEAKPLTPIVEHIYGKGIPVVIIDRKTSSKLYTAYVGADNYEIGKMAGQYVGTTLNGKAEILEITGLPGSSPAIERQRGFADGIKQFHQASVSMHLHGDWTRKKAEIEVNKAWPEMKGITAIFAHNDVMAAGAKNVLSKLGKAHNAIVVGIDALPGAGGGLQMIADKTITASLVYPTGGKEAIITALRILNKESFVKENILQSVVIDSTNVQLMKLQWNKISIQQQDIERQQHRLDEQEIVYNNQQLVLNITVITLVLAVVFGGLAFYSLLENRKINKSLELKNSEIIDQRNQLIDMSSKAEAATEAKLNFFTNISHEFRTPLTLILSPLEDMLLDDKLKQPIGKNLKLIHKNVFRLLKLINELISYRKIQYEKVKINVSPNNLVDFLNEILNNFQYTARRRNIDLKLISPKNEITVWFDGNLLDKVFFNLLSNAMKFTNDKGHIHILIRPECDLVYVDIEDTGIGMTPEEISHLFEHFYQAGTNSAMGSGLGVALVKEMIHLHHGSIEVNSKKWHGTTFTIALTLGNNHFSEDEINKEPLNKWSIREQAEIYTAELNGNVELVQPDQLIFKDHSILIIEDNQDLQNYLNNKLSEHFEVFTADNGRVGINEAYEKVPDLIISDIIMPNASGKELTENLKSDIRTSHIPIILLTAVGSIEQQITGIETMADAYITKPFNYEYLLATINNLIKNRLILKEHYTSEINVQSKPSLPKALNKKFLNDFAGIVEQNLANENLNVDDICKAIGVSRVQLYRKVKALLDCNVNEYILNRRLKKAKYLLINENLSIAEITYMVGFSTPNYFSTVFKSKYGFTPSSFKQNHLMSQQKNV